ncbi:EAL domain-containing protein [Deinococcus frigens]
MALLVTAAFALTHLAWITLAAGNATLLWPGQVLYLGVMYAATLTCVLAARSGSGGAWPWHWIALAVATYALADTAYDLVEWRSGSVPTPTVIDALYLAFYSLFWLGSLALPRQPMRRAEAWRLTLDVGIVVGSLGVLVWYGVLAALLGAAEASLISKLVNLSYPVLDLCTLGLVLLVMRRSDRFRPEESLMALGMVAFIGGDLLDLFIDAHAGFASGTPVELFWTGGALIFALAAWSSRHAPRPGRSFGTAAHVTAQITRPLYALAPYLGLTACFALSLLTHDENTLAAHGALWGTAGVTLLVAFRQIAVLSDNTGLTAQLAALNATLEQRVTARTAEVEEGRAQLEARAREMAWQAHHDALTGLPNRAGFLSALGEAVAQQTGAAQTGAAQTGVAQTGAAQTGTAQADAGSSSDSAAPLAVLFLDLDGFKGVNDTLGHTVGDQLLIKVAARLRGALLPGEFTARLGGDEFMVLTSQPPQARAQQVLELFAPPFDLGGRPVRISASVGVSVYPDSGQDAESLYMHADVAMYEAKRAGKGAARVFVPREALRSRTALEQGLSGALERGEFRLHYQPIWDAAQRIVALEALLRWDSPELGLLSPDQFLPVVHETGLDEALGDWVLNEACAQLSRWHAAGHGGLRVAVNVFPAQFGRADFAGTVEAALARHGLDGTALELEVSAALLSGCEAHAGGVMRALDERGVQWSMCDFGAQFSALSPLLGLPIGVLKLDRSLIGALDGPLDLQAQARHAVQATAALAGALGLSVVAEGVETHAQWQAVTALGCDHSQGFWLAHPQTGPETDRQLQQAREHLPESVPAIQP